MATHNNLFLLLFSLQFCLSSLCPYPLSRSLPFLHHLLASLSDSQGLQGPLRSAVPHSCIVSLGRGIPACLPVPVQCQAGVISGQLPVRAHGTSLVVISGWLLTQAWVLSEGYLLWTHSLSWKSVQHLTGGPVRLIFPPGSVRLLIIQMFTSRNAEHRHILSLSATY